MFRLAKLALLGVIAFAVMSACAPAIFTSVVDGARTGGINGFNLSSLTSGASESPVSESDKAAYANLCPLFTAWNELNGATRNEVSALLRDAARQVETGDPATQAFVTTLQQALRAEGDAAASAAGLVLRECSARNG